LIILFCAFRCAFAYFFCALRCCFSAFREARLWDRASERAPAEAGIDHPTLKIPNKTMAANFFIKTSADGTPPLIIQQSGPKTSSQRNPTGP
jgi:hypothetical protein